MIDSQAVKNTCNAANCGGVLQPQYCLASVESKGFCHYKCTNGIKRHLAVDTLGLPFFTHCTKANVTDDQGLIEIANVPGGILRAGQFALSHHLDYFRAKPVNIPRVTILLDHGYHSDLLTTAR